MVVSTSKMDIWSTKLPLTAWTVMNLLCVFSHEVTVRPSNLKKCENDKQVCVTDLRDCGPKPPSSIQKNLNMSCYYEKSDKSVSCEWSESNIYTDSEVSLIFRSRNEISSCQAIFNPVAVLNITARVKNYMAGREIRSQPHTVALYNAIRPSQPVLTVLGSTADSVNVSWRSSSEGSCRIRYRVSHSHVWTQLLYFVSARQYQTLTHNIEDLQPFTVYRVAVACRHGSDFRRNWSKWSSDVTARTLARVPSRVPEVCYRVEKTDSAGSFNLHLTWKDHENCGILGYRVSYKPMKKRQQLQDTLIQNVTDLEALLVVEDGNHSIAVTAFNTAGYGPTTNLSIDTQRQIVLPSVRNLWVSSSLPAMKSLRVRWERPTALPSVPPVSHYTVQWHSETRPSTSRWTTVDNFNHSALIQDVDPDESYVVTVFPVYNQHCGSPLSLPASLQQGALMEVVKMTAVAVTKTTVTVAWAWERKSDQSVRVDRYSVMLRKDSDRQKAVYSSPVLSLWPDQRHDHTFLNLTPNTQYSLLLLADNASRNIIPVTTDIDEVPVVATVTPLLLLAVTVFIISILSRTVYKSYFFPTISSPRGSTTGQWLMDPNHQKTTLRNILNIEDFQVTDVLGQKSVILVGSSCRHSSEEDLQEDASLLSISRLINKLSALQVDTDYISDAPVTTEHQLVSLQSYIPDSTARCHHPDSIFISEESRAADAILIHRPQEANRCFPQKEEESRQIDFSEMLHQKETALKLCFHDLMANTNSYGVDQMPCEAEYMLNSSFLGKTDVETLSGQSEFSYLICETDYKANSFFTAKTADVR